MQWFFRAGELAQDGWDVLIDASIPGWQHTGARVGTLHDGKTFHIPADGIERLITPLEGEGLSIEYRLEGEDHFATAFLRGRESVFHGPADNIYLPVATEIRISGSGRVVISEAPAKNIKPVRFQAAEDCPVVVRGAGHETRQVYDIGGAEALDADRFIVVEVIVPSGNWSGMPPHKHDTFIPGVESNLEEIYYFETAVTRGMKAPLQSDPTGFLRAYASDERPIDITEEVRSGDVGLIPYGWHGPVMATPGADLYFLNVMAGPDPERTWNITDDPNYAWIRESWHHRDPDPRLPYTK
jgi:5-deoxy-glucuronate isomerase